MGTVLLSEFGYFEACWGGLSWGYLGGYLMVVSFMVLETAGTVQVATRPPTNVQNLAILGEIDNPGPRA